MGIVIFSFGYAKSIDAVETNFRIRSSVDDGEVVFPSYAKFVSRTIRERFQAQSDEPIRMPYSTQIIKIVCDSVKRLPGLARNVKGERVYPISRDVYESKLGEGENPTDQIILGNEFVGTVARSVSASLEDETIELVYKAVSDLGIQSLRNAYAFEVMLRAVNSAYREITQQDRQRYKDLSDVDKTSFLANKVLERERWIHRFSTEQFRYIKKHLMLYAINRTELTVADYITSSCRQANNIREDDYVNLRNKKITNLVGVDLIQCKDQIRHIDLSNNAILGNDQDPDFPTKPFELYDHLEILELRCNQLSDVSERIFCGLNELKYLSLSSNKICSLHANVFRETTHLRRLDLSNNQMSEMPGALFSTTKDLRELYVSDNDLVALSTGLFDATPKIEKISLRNNKIATIEPNLFRKLHALYWFDLTDNKLSALSSSVFEGLDCLTHLYLSKNQMNALEKSVFYPLKNLQLIDLSHNHLAVLSNDLFCKSLNLINIDLSGNQLHDLPGDVFRCNRKLHYLNTGNKGSDTACGTDITDIEKSLDRVLNSLIAEMEKKSGPC